MQHLSKTHHWSKLQHSSKAHHWSNMHECSKMQLPGNMQQLQQWSNIQNWTRPSKMLYRLLLLQAACCLVVAPSSPGLRTGGAGVGNERCSSNERGSSPGILSIALEPWTTAAFLGCTLANTSEASVPEHSSTHRSPASMTEGRSSEGSGATLAPFETGIVHIPRNIPAHFALLQLSTRDIMSMLGRSVSLERETEGSRTMQHGLGKDFQVVKRVKGPDGEWWSGAAPPTSMTPPEVIAWVRKGFTLIFNSVDCRFPALAALAAGLEQELGFVIQMNAYMTPKNSQGFEVHWDRMYGLLSPPLLVHFLCSCVICAGAVLCVGRAWFVCAVRLLCVSRQGLHRVACLHLSFGLSPSPSDSLCSSRLRFRHAII